MRCKKIQMGAAPLSKKQRHANRFEKTIIVFGDEKRMQQHYSKGTMVVKMQIFFPT